MNETQILELVKLLGIPLLNWIIAQIKKRWKLTPEQRDKWIPVVAVLLGAIGNIAASSGISPEIIVQGAGYGGLASVGFKLTHRSSRGIAA